MNVRSIILTVALTMLGCYTANAQFGKVLNKAKRAISETEQKADNTSKQSGNTSAKMNAISGNSSSAPISLDKAPSLYVSLEKGSARADGSKNTPFRDVQKAINMAKDGDVIRIAQGNYLGTLDKGSLSIKGKYVSLEGGWNDDFTERDPLKYVTKIQPSAEQQGTIGMGLLMIESTANKNASIVIDGICFDLGLAMSYCKADPTDPRFGCPEGCETGRIMPVGMPPNKTIRLIGGKVAGNLTIRNCMFLNASFNGIIMTNMGGNWNIYNNIFVSNLYAACEITGGLNQNTNAHQSKVEFHHNTVLFSWPTTKEMESMGYGYRFRNGADHDVHHNIFGCNNYGALDGGWDDSTLPAEKRKICSAHDNYFFMNRGDLVLAGGGKWLYVPAKRFDEADMLTKYENNKELPATSNFKDFIDDAYLKGYASLEVITTESYDANSAANLYREAHGLNKMGTSTTRVTMFGNRYNFEKALKLFGAESGYGAQIPQ